MAFNLHGRNATLTRPSASSPLVSGIGWARNRSAINANDGYEVVADDINELFGQLRATLTALDGDTNGTSGDELAVALLAKFASVDANAVDGFRIFASAQDLEAATISSTLTELATFGYYAMSDGGAARYVRETTLLPGGLTSADGAHWNLLHNGQIDVRTCGAKASNSSADGTINSDAFDAAFALARLVNGNVVMPAGTFYLARNLVAPLPLAVANGYGFVGAGMHLQTRLVFTGSAVTSGLVFEGGSGTFQYWGRIADFRLDFVSGAVGGLRVAKSSAPDLESIYVNNGASTHAFEFEECNKTRAGNLFAINSGTSSKAQVRINRCTKMSLRDCYLATSASSIGGLSIDRSSEITIEDNAIESCGIPIVLAGETESVLPVDTITIAKNNLENPAADYINGGFGWSSGIAIVNLTSFGNKGSVSGSLTVGKGYNLQRVTGFTSDHDKFGIVSSISGAATYAFDSNSRSMRVGRHDASFGNTFPWVRIGGTQIVEAGPSWDWNYGTGRGAELGITRSGTTSVLDNRISAAQGGLYERITVVNGSATTINTTAAIPSTHGGRLGITSADGNTTIAHLGGTGNGKFNLPGGANLALANARTVWFTYDANTGNWNAEDSAGGVGGGDMLGSNNLSDVASKARALDTISVHGADIASASTVNLDTATGDLVDITGTTVITAITLAEGRSRTVRFTGILTLTHGSSLVLPTGANITTAAGDFAILRGYAAGVVRVVDYSRASGAALVASGGDLLATNNLSDVASKPRALDNISVRGADIASASTVNLDTATGDLVDITGTTAITAITLADGRSRTVRFTGALTLTHGSSLVLPTGANITTAAGDFAVLRGYAAGVVRVVDYSRANGTALVASGGDLLAANNLSDVASKPRALDTISVHGADIASASTVNLDTATGDLVDITGTTAITAITLAEGRSRTVRFTGILTLTHGSSLVLPTAANITTAAGDFAILRGYAAGVVRCVNYMRASGAALAGGAGGGAPPTIQVFASSGTWTKPSGCQTVKVTTIGGGGSGGSAAAAGGGTASAGSGGGGGGTSIKYIDVTAISTVAVTIGSGGTAPAAGNNPGNAGGTTSFGAHCSATGGNGGGSFVASTNNGSGGGAGGVGSGGDINFGGSGGGNSLAINGAIPVAGIGGGTSLGGSTAAPSAFSAVGNAAQAYGAGGSGAPTNTATARAGGAGANGVCIVEEFY